jgi:hypothetical protein
MKINASEFWEEIGTVFNNPEDILAEEYNIYDDITTKFVLLTKGTYLIMDKDDFGYKLYDIVREKNKFFEAGWVEEDLEFETVHIQPLEVLELAAESITKTILTLTSEGWEANPEDRYFDLTPEIKKLETIVTTLKILKKEDSK